MGITSIEGRHGSGSRVISQIKFVDFSRELQFLDVINYQIFCFYCADFVKRRYVTFNVYGHSLMHCEDLVVYLRNLDIVSHHV